MLEIIKQFVRRMLMGKGKGILQIPPQNKVDEFANDLFKKFKQNGVPDEAVNNANDVKAIWNQITNKEAQILSTNLKDVLTPPLSSKKAGDVFDLTGKKIDTSKPILGGKNVPESEVQNNMEKMREFIIKNQSSKTAIPLPDIVTETITLIKSKKPIDAMKEANLVIGRKGKYKNLTIDESQDILKKTNDHIFERDIKYDEFGEIIKPDPEDFAQGGRSGLNYLLGEDDQNVRMPFGKGKLVDAGRRWFLEMMGGAAAGAGAAKSGLFGLLKGGGKKEIIEEVVKQSASSGTPPAYFFNLVKKIKNLGDDAVATQDKAVAKTYKDYTLQEDFAGNIEIMKKGEDVAEDVFMSYKVDEVPFKKGKKKSTKVEEYEEYTATPDKEGKMKDIEMGVPDSVVEEGTVFEDTIAEFTKKASGGRVPLGGGGVLKGILALGKGTAKGEGKFTKAEVLLQMFENTIKQSKSAKDKKRFLNFIEEIKGKPELANDPKVWGFFTEGLPKNQKLVVYGDDTVDFWRQSDFGPHNIKTTDKFMKKHPNLSRDEAVRIQNMEPEDQIFEMKRLETIRNRTANATGGRVSLSAGGLAGMLGE